VLACYLRVDLFFFALMTVQLLGSRLLGLAFEALLRILQSQPTTPGVDLQSAKAVVVVKDTLSVMMAALRCVVPLPCSSPAISARFVSR
jgi:hypothetical protein